MEMLKTKAILLKYHNYGESSRIYTFFTRDVGKVKLDARGARKSKKRMLTTIDLLTYHDVTFRLDTRKSIQTLADMKPLDAFFNIRTDLNKLSLALYFSDLVSEFFKEYECNEKVFDELLGLLVKLDKEPLDLALIPVFMMTVLEEAGLAPNLGTCIKCGDTLGKKGANNINFIVSKGGCVCELCNTKKIKNRISLGTLKALTLARDANVKKSGRLKFTAQSVKESTRILSEFIRYNLGKRPKSYEYLHKLSLI